MSFIWYFVLSDNMLAELYVDTYVKDDSKVLHTCDQNKIFFLNMKKSMKGSDKDLPSINLISRA